MGDSLSPADYAAINGNNGFGGDGGWAWLIIILAMFNGGFGFGGGFGGFGGFGMDFMYPWIANGQQEIMQNTNTGFDTLHLSNQIEGVRDGVYGISNQLCNSTASVVQAVNSGFSDAEISANSRQMANMQQAFNSEIATLNGFNNLNNSLQNCCCENRLGIANLNSTILAENCADRAVLQEGVRDIITNQTANTQRILDQLCADKIDSKNEKIADLERQLTMADLKASQVAQTAQIQAGFVQANKDLYELLDSCPVGTTPVYRKNTDI